MGLRKDVEEITASGLVDEAWYLSRYADAGAIGLGAAEHYLRIGAHLLRDPGPRFSTSGYLGAYPGVAGNGINPLVHYVRYGRAEGRQAVAAAGSTTGSASMPNLAGRWSLRIPTLRGLDPGQVARIRDVFDSSFYLSQNEDVRSSGLDPFVHYMMKGWKEGRDPAACFSTSYYLRRAPDVRDAGMNPFVHYVLHGIDERRPALPFRRRLLLADYRPKVSVVVPNFNHGRFLVQRIESILAQTYRNIEILVLDDCSSDDSREVVAGLCQRYPDRLRTIFNERNSGNVFRQWRKGFENTSGELVWICESDDFCEPDFLEKLVPEFRDRSVNIAFGRIQFTDGDGRFRAGLDNYREGAEPGIWNAPVVRPACQWFANGFGVNNVIANVGGCIIRRQSLSRVVWEEAETYSILGDWFLYCHLAGGGQIAFQPEAVAYFRQHGDNTSVTSFSRTPYYVEHQRLMTLLRERWEIPEATIDRFIGKVAFQYDRFGLEEKYGPFERYVEKRRLLATTRSTPHILIAFLGFHPGGGEVFPINLANALRGQGWLVSMLALDSRDANREMLASLDSSIPVYDASYVEELGVDQFLANAGISLIHSHMVSLEAFFFEKCRMQSRLPYLVTLHGSYEASGISSERLSGFVHRITHWVYTADRNLEPFEGMAIPVAKFSKFGNAMPMDDRPFPKTRQELGIAPGAVVFTLVARGILRKGWRAAITAFKQVRDRNPHREVHLLLCGDGPEMKRHAEVHQTDPDITFLGYQSCIHGLYRLSDCAVVPTRFSGESFPLCIIQALQTGTPVIATKVGEVENMMAATGRVPGILLENQRNTNAFIADLQKAMAEMLVDSTRSAHAEAAYVAGARFSMDAVARDYKELYASMLTVHSAQCEDVACQSD